MSLAVRGGGFALSSKTKNHMCSEHTSRAMYTSECFGKSSNTHIVSMIKKQNDNMYT